MRVVLAEDAPKAPAVATEHEDVPCEECGRPWPARQFVGLEHGKRGCWPCQNDWLERSGIREPRERAEWTVGA